MSPLTAVGLALLLVVTAGGCASDPSLAERLAQDGLDVNDDRAALALLAGDPELAADVLVEDSQAPTWWAALFGADAGVDDILEVVLVMTHGAQDAEQLLDLMGRGLATARVSGDRLVPAVVAAAGPLLRSEADPYGAGAELTDEAGTPVFMSGAMSHASAEQMQRVLFLSASIGGTSLRDWGDRAFEDSTVPELYVAESLLDVLVPAAMAAVERFDPALVKGAVSAAVSAGELALEVPPLASPSVEEVWAAVDVAERLPLADRLEGRFTALGAAIPLRAALVDQGLRDLLVAEGYITVGPGAGDPLWSYELEDGQFAVVDQAFAGELGGVIVRGIGGEMAGSW